MNIGRYLAGSLFVALALSACTAVLGDFDPTAMMMPGAMDGGGGTDAPSGGDSVLPDTGGGTDAPAGSFTLSAAPRALVKVGKTATVKVQIARGAGFTSPLVFLVSGLPTNVTGTAPPVDGTMTEVDITLTATNTATIGDTGLATIQATGGGVMQSTSISVTVSGDSGTIDPTFPKTSPFVSGAQTLVASALDPSNDTLIVVGQLPGGSVAWRINRDGTRDTTYAGLPAPGVAARTGEAAVLQPDGKLVVAWIVGSTLSISRFTASGTLDPTFGTAGTVLPPTLPVSTVNGTYSASLDASGSVLVGDYLASGNSIYIQRWNSAGTLDTTIGPGGSGLVTIGSGGAVLQVGSLGGIVTFADHTIGVAGLGTVGSGFSGCWFRKYTAAFAVDNSVNGNGLETETGTYLGYTGLGPDGPISVGNYKDSPTGTTSSFQLTTRVLANPVTTFTGNIPTTADITATAAIGTAFANGPAKSIVAAGRSQHAFVARFLPPVSPATTYVLDPTFGSAGATAFQTVDLSVAQTPVGVAITSDNFVLVVTNDPVRPVTRLWP